MNKLQRKKLFIMLALFWGMLLFSSAGMFAIFSATTKSITCERSKEIKRSYPSSKTKTRRTYSSTYGRFIEETKTHYYLCLETTEKKCLQLFNGTEFRLDEIPNKYKYSIYTSSELFLHNIA